MKPKTIRLELIDALGTEERTIDAMIDLLPQHDRKKLANNLQAAKTDGLISVRRDDSTGLPAYRLTASGLAMLAASRGNGKPGTEERKAESQVNGTGESLPKAEAKETISLLGVIADIRRAIGDDTGKVMLSELAETISAHMNVMRSACSDLGAVAQHLGIDPELGGAAPILGKLREMSAQASQREERNVSLTNQVEAEHDEVQHRDMPGFGAVHEALKASQYLILSPKRKPQRVKSHEKAQTIALSAARSRGMAEVYALIPAGRALRGAVWSDAR